MFQVTETAAPSDAITPLPSSPDMSAQEEVSDTVISTVGGQIIDFYFHILVLCQRIYVEFLGFWNDINNCVSCLLYTDLNQIWLVGIF